MSSEIAQLRERLLLEGGLYGYGDVAKHEIIRQRNRQMSQTIQQLDSHIGEEETDVILCEAMELASQAYQKEQQLKRIPAESTIKKAAKRSRRQQ